MRSVASTRDGRPPRHFSAQAKFHALAPLLEFRVRTRDDRRGIYSRPFTYHGREFRSLRQLINCIARKLGSRPSTLWQWLRAFDRRGFEGLITRRPERGTSRWFAARPAATEFVRHYFRARWSAPAIHRALAAELDDPPSYTTVWFYVRSLRAEARAERLRKRRETEGPKRREARRREVQR